MSIPHLAISGQGVPAHSIYGGTPLGANERYGVPSGAMPIPGSSGEVDQSTLPCGVMKLDGSGPCSAPRVSGHEVCVGHKRSQEKKQKGS